MPDLRSANKARRRRQILLAAHDLIGRGGMEALTMRALADGAQVSVPTVYSLVGGREDVIAALMAAAVRQFDHGVGLLDTRGLARVLEVTELFTGIVADERELVRGFLASGVLSETGVDQFPLLHRTQRELEAAFAEAVTDGTLKPITQPAVAAIAAVRLGLGGIIDWVVRRRDDAALRDDLSRSIAVVIAACS